MYLNFLRRYLDEGDVGGGNPALADPPETGGVPDLPIEEPGNEGDKDVDPEPPETPKEGDKKEPEEKTFESLAELYKDVTGEEPPEGMSLETLINNFKSNPSDQGNPPQQRPGGDQYMTRQELDQRFAQMQGNNGQTPSADASHLIPQVDMGSPIEEAVKAGHIGKDDAQGYSLFGNMIEKSINPEFDKVHNISFKLAMAVDQLAKEVVQMRGNSVDQEWNTFEGNFKGFDRKALDKLREQHNLKDYNSAAMLFAQRNPDLLKALTDAVGTDAINKASKKRSLATYARGGKSAKGGLSVDISAYRKPTGGLNKGKLDRDFSTGKINEKERRNIVKAIMADLKAKGMAD